MVKNMLFWVTLYPEGPSDCIFTLWSLSLNALQYLVVITERSRQWIAWKRHSFPIIWKQNSYFLDKLKHFAFPPFSSKDVSLTWNLTYSSASDLNGEGSFLYVVKEALSSFGLLWSQAKRFEHLSFSQVPQQSTCPFQRRKEFINADPFQSNPVPLKMNTLAQGTCVGLMSKRHTQPRAQPEVIKRSTIKKP